MKTTAKKKRELWQNNRIHGLCAKRRLGKAERALLVRQITKGRTNSTKDLLFDEANQLIHHLEAGSVPKEDPADKMRKKILHYFHNMGWQDADGKVIIDDVESWMIKHSFLNKSINAYTLEELPKLVSQVQSMHKKHLEKL